MGPDSGGTYIPSPKLEHAFEIRANFITFGILAFKLARMPQVQPINVLVVDPDRARAATLEAAVRTVGSLIWCNNISEALAKGSANEQIFIAGLSRPARETANCLHELQMRFPNSASVLVAEYGDYMALDSATRTRDNFLLAFRPFEITKLMTQLDRAVNAVKLSAQLAKMRDVLNRERAK